MIIMIDEETCRFRKAVRSYKRGRFALLHSNLTGNRDHSYPENPERNRTRRKN